MTDIDKLKELYDSAREIPKDLILINKYTLIAGQKILEAKYLDINDALSNANLSIKSYISANNQVLLFPNRVNGIITDIFIKPLKKANPLKLGLNTFPYNIGNLQPNFTYGDPIVLVEGIGDLASLSILLPNINVIAMQTSTLSNDHLELLSTITNNFYILHDNDKAGIDGAKKLYFRFKKKNCDLKSLNQFYGFKDSGTLLDLVITYLNTYDDNTKNIIDNAKIYYRTLLKNI